ncbi:Uma2 family endonuclease [Capilliphycus salinus ALCB114379]|uniref:Uma2 family endonuclease n=1 Tax=Capilliphycus salinus TaxID=2768948 RepID=UPI0039A6140E
MNTQDLTLALDSIKLSDIRWETYEHLLKDISQQRRLRLTYYQGELEIMVPSPEHEFYKEVIGRFVETLAEELQVSIYPLGSTTFKQAKNTGAEPYKCFYIRNIERVRGKKRLNFVEDPPPDLVVEIDITSSSDTRLKIYAELGVPEVWIYNRESLLIKQLQNQAEYISTNQSLFFPNLPLNEITTFLTQAETMDYLTLVREFRQWIRRQLV